MVESLRGSFLFLGCSYTDTGHFPVPNMHKRGDRIGGKWRWKLFALIMDSDSLSS